MQPPFKGNQVLGGSTSETQPKTVAVLPTGNAQLVLSDAALEKLKNVGPPPGKLTAPFAVKLAPVAPTTIVCARSSADRRLPDQRRHDAPDRDGRDPADRRRPELTQNLEAAPTAKAKRP